MKHIITTILLTITTWSFAQVKFTQMERAATKWDIPSAYRVVPGIPDYVMKYISLPDLVDSLGITFGTTIDSMKYATDTLSLYTSAGIFKTKIASGTGTVTGVTGTAPIVITGTPTVAPNVTIQTANTTTTGAITGLDWTTFNNKVGGAGVANKVAFWTGENTLSNNNLFHWDNVNSRLSIGNTTPVARLNVTGRFQIQNNVGSVYIGNLVGNETETGFQNTGIGVANLRSMTTGVYNLALGNNVLDLATTGSSNLGFGNSALFSLTTGTHNVAIGTSSLFSNNGANNIAIGRNSARLNTGNTNVAIGLDALSGNVAGSNNVALGHFSLRDNLGSGNVAIGYFAGLSETGSNKLYIENTTSATPLIGGYFDTNRVGINRAMSSINSTLHVGGDLTVDTRTGTATDRAGFDATGKVVAIAGLGSTGTVTSVSSGNFSPLFNVAVATETTTPALSFTSISQTQKTVYAAPNAANGNPTFRQLIASDIPTLEPAITAGTTAQYWRGDKTWQTLNTSVVQEGTNLYFTNARARTAISLTTTGTSGAATYNSGTGVLNVPNYATGGPGTGTVNYIPKWATTTTLSATSKLFDNGTNVGVNTNLSTNYFGTGTSGLAIFKTDSPVLSLANSSLYWNIQMGGTSGANTFLDFWMPGLSAAGMTIYGDRYAYFPGYIEAFGLRSGSTPPATTGTTKMVITDFNGKFSFADIPSSGGGTMSSWNIAASGSGGSGTVLDGETVTITAGTGIAATRATRNVTIKTDLIYGSKGHTPTVTYAPSTGLGSTITMTSHSILNGGMTGATSSAITVPSAGKYDIAYSLSHSAVSTACDIIMGVTVDNSAILGSSYMKSTVRVGEYQIASKNFAFNLTSGGVYRLTIRTPSGSCTGIVIDNPELTITKID